MTGSERQSHLGPRAREAEVVPSYTMPLNRATLPRDSVKRFTGCTKR